MLIWRFRRASPINRASATDKVITDSAGQPDSPLDQPVPEPGLYMDLHPRPLDGQSGAPAECKSLQGKGKSTEYYNVGFSKQSSGRKLVSPHDQRVTAAYMNSNPGLRKGHPMHFLSTRVYRAEARILNIAMWDLTKAKKQEEIYDEVGNAQC